MVKLVWKLGVELLVCDSVCVIGYGWGLFLMNCIDVIIFIFDE